MQIKFLGLNKNEASLAVLKQSSTKMELIHSNWDDGYYTYHFEVEGTEQEIETITKFCTLLKNATKIKEPNYNI